MQEDPQEKLEQFFLERKKLYFKKKEIILRVGDSPSGAYYLHEGYIKDSSLSSKGEEFTLFIFKPQDIFPYNWIFNKLPNEHSFTTMTNCVVLRRNREEFLEFLEGNPDILFMLMQKILIRLRGLLQRLEQFAFGNASQRVASILKILGDRFGEKTPKGILIKLPVSHKDIAELTGIARETASIEIKKFEDSGIINRNGKFYYLKRLRKLSALSTFDYAPS